VVGGSAADGYGLDGAPRYLSIWERTFGLERVELIRQPIRMPDALQMLSDVVLNQQDILVLHAGLADCQPRMPEAWRKLVKVSRRGRGRMEAYLADRRLWSRARRRFAVALERGLNTLALRTGRTHPQTRLAEFEASVRHVERLLQRFEGLVICVVPERAASTPRSLDRKVRPYSIALRNLLIDRRRACDLPVVSIDLAEILTDDDYLADGFHPNAAGHAKIGNVGCRAVRRYGGDLDVVNEA